jgi:hypothetical protein
MPINRKPTQAEPSPRMRYYLSNLPAQVRSQADYERLSKVLAEIPRDIIAERISHQEYRILDREIAKRLRVPNKTLRVPRTPELTDLKPARRR